MPNPRTKEFPLKHRFGCHFSFKEEDTGGVENRTIIPLYFADQAKTDVIADDIQVHPANDAYEGTVISSACFMNSRVNMVKISEYCMIPPAHDVPDMLYQKAVIAFGLGDSDVEDPAGVTLMSKIQFEKTANALLPLFNTAKLANANLMSTDLTNLTSTQLMEEVTMDPDQLRSEMSSGTLYKKLQAMITGPFTSRVHKDYPYWREQWYKTPPRCRRMLAFTGCYLYVGIQSVVAAGAAATATDLIFPHFDSETTVDENSLSCHFLIEFNEYNDSFDQSP